MAKQTFVVTLETSSLFEDGLPAVTPTRMAEIVRDVVQEGSCNLPFPVPFEVTVDGTQETASTSGQIRAHARDAFEEAEQAATWGE